MTEPVTAVGAIRRFSPPWLRRTHAARLLEAIADVLDQQIARLIEGVKLRFPGAPPRELAIDEGALALTGRDRRIRRGPGESASTYARRLQLWWVAHRTRGGHHALLGQLDAFFEDWLNVRMDVVDHSGKRTWIDADSVITSDSITWSVLPDGTTKWARFWVFFHVPDLIPVGTAALVTDTGDTLVTSDGDTIVAPTAMSPGALSAADEEIFRCIPREWSAAHIDRIVVVLLWGGYRLWDYPQPVPTWDEPGAVWQLEDPTVLVIEE